MRSAHEWSQACYRAGEAIFRYGGLGVMACAGVPAMVNAEATFDDAIAAGLLALSFIFTAGLFLCAVGLGIAMGIRD